MSDSKMQTIGDLARFVRGSARVKLKAIAHRERYAWISATLAKFKYWLLRKKDKSIVKSYLLRMTGFSDAQMTRLITRRILQGRLTRQQGRRHSFPRRYNVFDIALLADTDNLHQRLSGPATKKLF